MDEARVVQHAEAIGHGEDHRAAGGFVAAGPHQHAGVVLIALEDGIDAVEQDGLPVHALAGEEVLLRPVPMHDHIPYAVGFHVVFVDDIQAQLIGDGIQAGSVGIMAGADGVDVVALHGDQIAADLPLRHSAPGLRAVVVPVDALEDDAPAVEMHDAVDQLEPAEADLLADEFVFASICADEREFEVVQVGLLCAPEVGMFHREGKVKIGAGRLAHGKDVRAVGEHQAQRIAGKPFLNLQLHADVEHGVFVCVVQQRLDVDIRDMRGGRSIEEDVAEEAGKAHEVLILEPASGAEADDLTAELVFALDEIGRELEIGRGEGIGREADVMPVQPDGDAAFRALEGNKDALSLPAFGQEEVLAVAGDGVKVLGDVADLDILDAVPGILDVHILRRAVALHLDMRGDGDIRPRTAAEFRRFEAAYDLSGIERMVEFPKAIQAHAQAGFARHPFRPAGKGDVIGVGGNAVFGKIGGISDLIDAVTHDDFSPCQRIACCL